MAVAGRFRRAGEAWLLAALLVAVLPGRAAAADGEVVLTDDALSSLAADLDGDGRREVIAIVAGPEEGAPLRVAAWGVRDGAWVSLGEQPVQRWVESDQAGRTARIGEDAASLLAMVDGGEKRVVVASGTPYADGVGGACCLSLSTATLVDGVLRLTLVPEDLGSSENLWVLDMEGDGRDELLVSRYVQTGSDPSAMEATLLRRAGSAFVAEPVPVPDDEPLYLASVGESDGVAGDELLFVSEAGNSFVRMTSRDGALDSDRADARAIFGGRPRGWIAGATDGLVILSSEQGIDTGTWPRDGALALVSTTSVGIFPNVLIVGSGPDARLVELTGTDFAVQSELGMRIYDLDLQLELELGASTVAEEMWATTTADPPADSSPPDIYPHMGPIHGGLADGRAAFLGLGNMVAIEPSGSHEVQPASVLTGGDVLGLVGPESAWLAIGAYGGGVYGYLGLYGFEPGGFEGARVSVVPFAAIVGHQEEPVVELAGATMVETVDGPMLFTGEGGFQATVAGAPGTRVITTVGGRASTEEMQAETLTVTVEPGGSREGSGQEHVRIFVISPGGVARVVSWEVTTLLEQPELTAVTAFDLFETSSTIAGRVTPGTSVTVDGRAVEPDANGTFLTTVGASIWPREVVVVARDQIGKEQVRRLDVVGFADPRVLPWIPIVAALTITAGIVLFLRTPRVRLDRPIVHDGDGHLEEVDGDTRRRGLSPGRLLNSTDQRQAEPSSAFHHAVRTPASPPGRITISPMSASAGHRSSRRTVSPSRVRRVIGR